jgi:hypothetical protein
LAFHSRREADHSPPSGAGVGEWVELCLHSPNAPSWRGAQLGGALGQLYFLHEHATRVIPLTSFQINNWDRARRSISLYKLLSRFLKEFVSRKIRTWHNIFISLNIMNKI